MIKKIVKWGTDYCAPCKALDKVLDEFTDVPVEKCNADDEDLLEACLKANIRSVPTLIFYNEEDEEVARNIGFITLEALREKIKALNEN